MSILEAPYLLSLVARAPWFPVVKFSSLVTVQVSLPVPESRLTAAIFVLTDGSELAESLKLAAL